MNYPYIVVTLNELLAVSRDGEQGFAECAERAHSAVLRELFAARARRHAAASATLAQIIVQLHGVPAVFSADSPARRGSLLGGAYRRGWGDLHGTLVVGDDAALISHCERGIGHALEVYRNALDDHMPEFVREVLLRQFEDLMDDTQEMRFFRHEASGSLVASSGGDARQ